MVARVAERTAAAAVATAAAVVATAVAVEVEVEVLAVVRGAMVRAAVGRPKKVQEDSTGTETNAAKVASLRSAPRSSGHPQCFATAPAVLPLVRGAPLRR